MKTELDSGQRGFTAILTVLLMIIGAVLGDPGSFPLDKMGNVLSPQFLLEGGLPIALFLTMMVQLWKNIDMRVNDPDDAFEAGKLLDLLKIREFWVALITMSVGILSLFGVKFFSDPEEQAVLVTLGMSVANALLYSWNQRSAGSTAEPLIIN